jgi:hypothetical protein
LRWSRAIFERDARVALAYSMSFWSNWLSLLHDPAHGKVHVLNATAGAVLEMCDGARSAEEIARSLCDATGTDTVVARDVEAILREFGTLRLLVT